ncbi:hypothetical protein NPIL_363621 [Nephila pilipes]|uniref:Uncharacterized protein n=1 Tax=Nephila pilipes TaxID=299642 RepID=A0A8X6NYY2_NEPPI|nr:hypothetical protein NPIL_363621 [Nephila pilipes]
MVSKTEVAAYHKENWIRGKNKEKKVFAVSRVEGNFLGGYSGKDFPEMQDLRTKKEVPSSHQVTHGNEKA